MNKQRFSLWKHKTSEVSLLDIKHFKKVSLIHSIMTGHGSLNVSWKTCLPSWSLEEKLSSDQYQNLCHGV